MTVKQRMTAEELWAMPEVPGKTFELVDGELVEMAGTGGLHALIAGLVYRLIYDFAFERGLGPAFGDNTAYLLRRDPDLLRIPDVSFVAAEHVPEEGVPEGFWSIPPDLAVEIVSPADIAEEVHTKVREYLEAGTAAVWVLWPRHQTVTVHAPDGLARELGPADEIAGGAVLPGFRMRVGDLFAVRRKW